MIRGFVYEPDSGQQAALRPEDLALHLASPTAVLWLDLDQPTPDELKLLDAFHFHPLAVEDATARQHHPKLEEFTDHLFIIAHTVRDDARPEEYRAVQMAMFLGRRWLVTVHAGMDEVDEIVGHCGGGLRLLKDGTAALCHRILDRMIDQYGPLMSSIAGVLESLEQTIFREYTENPLDQVFALKRSLSRIRQTAVHTRVLLHTLASRKSEFVDQEMQSYFRDVEDHAVRVVDECEAFREVVSDAIEAHASVTNHRLNQVMRVLTVIAVVFEPLTFLAGVYGMNFDNMPELHTRYGYFALLLVMAFIALVLVLMFRRRRWL
jgi:magnesium transporter